ncbi:Type I restriction-modification system methyltransferase subunit [Mycobacteroides abscessus subsp. abscessus]|uniref:BREX-1 system adenine-specific DNA-methyltransferase PglX n=1 Tax=Mycobacteroides abscessus TaxID=36809 RepID=UPI00092B6B2F|nr:BREX-1 system adenine-specific DNA-methyltransferase PglX [Mycobacteroides abscessus]SHU18143.1 Type I restriction-modification system methyltransferase subunit [Mycobacteroides abscessus subsp. abscessus]SHU21519.1 Type I restriction-modification system methyltransferase subunit [Mycobacteroides abscessus subsp. abscessus]
METAPLKSFATWARTALIREVTARIAVVLAPSSPERIEQPKSVAALEQAVKAAGGGDTGRSAAADRVAYTWFNRIIALRFMDANGYTGIGVVSPQAEIDVGQPEILAEAKRGNIDSAVVSQAVRETVTGLLDGTRRSGDPQGEAYALLLTEYCRRWNRAMPFMFEREGDYTELLIPANLLADDSVLNRAVQVLTPDVCRDVEVIGWLYQFYISERKDEVFAQFKKNKKAGADEIPAATQLFTPHWIVRYLVENSLGRIWMLNRPTSRLVEKMAYYIPPVDTATEFLKINTPVELKVIDPACGSGHMLTYAFDLLYAIYEEEGYSPSEIPGLILANNLYGTEIDPRAAALAAFAITMKARARQRRFFDMKVKPNVCVIEPIGFEPHELELLIMPEGDPVIESEFWNQFAEADVFGSLIRPRGSLIAPLLQHIERHAVHTDDLFTNDLLTRAHRTISQAQILSLRYAVVVTNPPYMGSKNMSGALTAWLKANYARSKSDLMTAFMERSAELCEKHGAWAMINLPSWMFLSSFHALREWLLTSQSIGSLVHLGRGVFGSDFGSVAFTVDNVPVSQTSTGVYRRLFEKHVDVRANSVIEALFLDFTYNRYEMLQHAFGRIPGSPIVYWMDPVFLRTFEEPSLGRFITTEGQNKTADNDRYLRYHWEVPRTSFGVGRRWIPYAKGGKFRRWYGNIEHAVDWSDIARAEYRRNPSCRIVAEEFWYREGITWTDISAKGTGFRYLPPGGTFDMAGPTAFLSSDVSIYSTLAVLNSSFVEAALQAINPTVHIQLKDVRSLPFPDHVSNHEELARLAKECVEVSRADWDELETSLDFARSPLARIFAEDMSLRAAFEELARIQRVAVARLAELEGRIDSLVTEMYDQSVKSHGKPSVTLWANPDHRYERQLEDREREDLRARDCVLDVISYAVGCMFGRFSLDEPGLILADQGATVEDYLAMVPDPAFRPDVDNVIPIVDGDWFEDDIVARFRQFLRVTFGERHFEENLRFVTESLGVKDLRDYFVKSFYKDHVQRYKKRPIYWLFSSPKGSFNALIYMHRYTPSTVSTVLNEYLREYKAKLESSLQHHQRLAAGGGTARQQAAAQKEADRLRKVLVELEEYEHDVLYPLASQQIDIDLDDGVKMNYPKFGAALKRIPGLEAGE